MLRRATTLLLLFSITISSLGSFLIYASRGGQTSVVVCCSEIELADCEDTLPLHEDNADEDDDESSKITQHKLSLQVNSSFLAMRQFINKAPIMRSGEISTPPPKG